MIAGKRILLVEDEVLVAMLLEDIVTELQAIVVGPESHLESALHSAETQLLDAAILDINLNGHRSYAVADVLKLRGVPFAFATGYGEAGVDPAHRGVPVLLKPYGVDDVTNALTRLLAHPG